MKRSRYGSKCGMRAAALCALTAASVAFQGCVPYTSNYLADPGKRSVRYAVAPEGPAVRSSRLTVEGLPTAADPGRPVTLRAMRVLSGPGVEIVSETEQRYKYYWAPIAIPVGLIGVAMTPLFVILSPIIDSGPDKPGRITVFGGWDPRGCEPKGLLLAYLSMSIGHTPTCAPEGPPRITENEKPAGREVTQESPVADAAIRVRLAAVGDSGTPAAGGKLFRAGKDGVAKVPMIDLLREMGDLPDSAEVVATLEGEPAVSGRAPIPAGALAALAGPIRAEREGDRAASAGMGLVALEHYVRAAGSDDPRSGNPGLWEKIAATYRTLPVKPQVSEASRRLVVQAEALSKGNDARGAIGKLREALRAAPWLPVARYNLAMAHAMEADYGAAIDSMNAYLQLAPNAPDARMAKDKVYEWEAIRPEENASKPGGDGRNRPAPPENRRGR